MLSPRQAGLSVCEGGLIVIIGLFPCNLLFYYLNRLVGKTHFIPLDFTSFIWNLTFGSLKLQLTQGYSSIGTADLIFLKSQMHLLLVYDNVAWLDQ